MKFILQTVYYTDDANSESENMTIREFQNYYDRNKPQNSTSKAIIKNILHVIYATV